MSNQLILWLMLIVPWLTLFFLKKEGIKRYISVTIFTALLVTIVSEMAYTYKWTEIMVKIVPWGHITNVSLAYGSFFITTIWVFYLTFEKFWLYLVTNIVIDGLGAFLITYILELRKISQLVNLSKLSLFLIMVTLSLIAYGFQVWYQKLEIKEE